MKQIITFLGKYPKDTTYIHEGQKYDGKVFAQALRQFCDFDIMLVCVTEEAKANCFHILESLNDSRIKPIDIPIGRTTAEMWETFKIITDQVNENDQVIFDITHGLRSLPFLAFLFAAYLKTAKKVMIDAIYYGAFELGDSKNDIPAPVIDLSEFVSMIDWITATDQFLQTGDARQLSSLINPDGNAKNQTKKAAKTLFDVSLATLLCQPLHLAKQAYRLEPDLLKAQEDLQQSLPPFEMLRQRITSTFSNFACDIEQDTKEGLQAQFKLILWYLENKRLIEAMTLSREWLINAVSYRLEISFTLKIKDREEIARAISGLDMVNCNRLSFDELNDYGKNIYNKWQEKDDLIKLWNALQPVRNALDHAGHQEGSMTIEKIIKKSEQIQKLLEHLALTWGLYTSTTQ